jgi:hypothetical protein
MAREPTRELTARSRPARPARISHSTAAPRAASSLTMSAHIAAVRRVMITGDNVIEGMLVCRHDFSGSHVARDYWPQRTRVRLDLARRRLQYRAARHSRTDPACHHQVTRQRPAVLHAFADARNCAVWVATKGVVMSGTCMPPLIVAGEGKPEMPRERRHSACFSAPTTSVRYLGEPPWIATFRQARTAGS